MAISVVAKLRIADLLADGPKTLADLAIKTKTHAPSLYRVLRPLAAIGVFAEQDDGRFALTPMGEYLRTGVKGSLRGMADFFGSDWSWRPGAICSKPSRPAAPPLTACLANRSSTISANTPTSRPSSTRA
jgi:hypothetical protein